MDVQTFLRWFRVRACGIFRASVTHDRVCTARWVIAGTQKLTNIVLISGAPTAEYHFAQTFLNFSIGNMLMIGMSARSRMTSTPVMSTCSRKTRKAVLPMSLPMLCFPIHGWVQTITFFMPALMLTTTNVASTLKCFRCAWYSL